MDLLKCNLFYVMNTKSSRGILCILETLKSILLANSDDQDEMQRNAAFHQGLHYLLGLQQPSDHNF